ncbi:polysaccharide biosynthesis tyrosine autokinase [Affinirhizobium pseudoryzae]|uniref:polysaccharide biosynthesis tyrosine autokinase n=1 Tax=Allorhizobium pseudoryzae TaxID=379684 RepID=UPI0013EA37FA|nr:polysaccharide biosynthesis tyrosine autokinase [Allorhizobium pseudoryzae]
MNDEEVQVGQLDLDKLIAAARRQWRVVALCVFVAIICGVTYLVTAVPRYTASTSILIDRGNSGVVQQLSSFGGMIDDEASVLSQVELLMSEAIGLAAVDKLRLADNAEFMASGQSILAPVRGAVQTLLQTVGISSGASEQLMDPQEKARRSALGILLDGLTVSRVGRSYVLEASFTSTSPRLSASVISAVAEAYLNDKLNAKYDATRRAGNWLQERIEELRQQSLASDMAVQRFRAENGLVQAGGKLVSDQQLAELNSALIVARADTARAQARYDRIQEIIASGQSDALVTDALDSSVINTLREKYLDASKREAEIAKRLGSDHIQAIRLRQEMAEYQRLMFGELRRIAESYQSELEVARSRERNITEGVAKATDVSVVANETQVQLRELERTAETYKNLYQTFLTRYQEATQGQSFPVTEARVISQAVPPTLPSSPKKALVLALSIILGGAMGTGIGAFREFRDRFFRTGEQIRDVLGLEFLGAIPLVKAITVAKKNTVAKTEIDFRRSISRQVVDHPLSSFAEALRAARIAIDVRVSKKGKIVGVVSTLPSEGKSTVSVNLAQILAQGGKTLLIDADLRNPGATRSIAQHAEAGLLEVLLEGKSYRDVLLHDETTGLDLLPAVVRRRVTHSADLLSSVKMSELLHLAMQDYDYVLLDLPPVGPVVDARAVARKIDGFVVVVEWGKTARKVVRDTLLADPLIAERSLGVVLNKVDTERMKFYRDYGSSEYYQGRYSSYYVDDRT